MPELGGKSTGQHNSRNRVSDYCYNYRACLHMSNTDDTPAFLYYSKLFTCADSIHYFSPCSAEPVCHHLSVASKIECPVLLISSPQASCPGESTGSYYCLDLRYQVMVKYCKTMSLSTLSSPFYCCAIWGNLAGVCIMTTGILTTPRQVHAEESK